MSSNQRILTKISPDILDTIGKSFKFKHAKGIAEWLKNSLDHYLRMRSAHLETIVGGWPVVIVLNDAAPRKSGPNLAVIDFSGTNASNIENFFLNWGSRSAATLGGSNSAAVAGGHGNGGKFYMREMWRNGSRFMTYRDSKATSLIVDKLSDGTTGYWEYEDADLTWREALEKSLSENDGLGSSDPVMAYLNEYMPSIIADLDAGVRGITVLAGRKAVQTQSSNDVVSGTKWDAQRLIDDIRATSQARRPLRELNIAVLVNGKLALPRLVPASFDEDPAWKADQVELPKEIIADKDLLSGATQVGYLTVRKSLSKLSGTLKEYNSLFITDKSNNPIAIYPLRLLPVKSSSTLLDFIQADLQILLPDTDALVTNDRERLVESPTSEAILDWVADQITALVQQLEDEIKSQKKQSDLQIASILNDALNKHAKAFLQEMQSQMLVDVIEDPLGGGQSRSGNGSKEKTEKQKEVSEEPRKGGDEGTGGDLEVPGESKPVTKPRFPQILLSSTDADPSRSDGLSKDLTEWHPPLEQNDIDKKYNVWWINTSHVFAVAAMNHGGARGSAFRSYQLFMFLEVVQREALRIVQKNELELGLDRVENELTEISNKFLSELPVDLITELLG